MALLLALIAGATPLAAQWRGWEAPPRPREPQPSAYIAGSFVAANPVGEFAQLVDDGFGFDLEGRFPLSHAGPLSLRLDGGFLIYGRERLAMCFPVPGGCRIGVDLNTYNSIVYLGVGPELSAPGAISPYVNGTVGVTWFLTNSSLSGADDYGNHFNTTNYSDWVTSLRVGGGLRFRVGGSPWRPVQLDVGAQYHRNGVANYLREGDIVDYPDGSIELYPNRTEANLMTFRVGISFGLGGGPDAARAQGAQPARRRR